LGNNERIDPREKCGEETGNNAPKIMGEKATLHLGASKVHENEGRGLLKKKREDGGNKLKKFKEDKT